MRTARGSCLLIFSALSPLAAPAMAADEQTAVETVYVTAQKRVQDVLDVPMSIEVLQGAELDDYQVRDFKALQNYVPNLLIQSSPGNDAIYMRGFGSPAANYAFDQTVSLYLDGIYGGRNRQFMAPFFDVERVEVMRGPQGALLGKNTAAGALSIVTSGPTDEFDASVTTSYNFERSGYEAYGHVSGPLGGGWSGRLAAKTTDLEGYIKNEAIGEDDPRLDNNLVRGSLRWEGDSIDVVGKIEYADFETLGTSAVRVSPINANLHDEKRAADPLGVPEEDSQTGVNASVTASFDVGEHTITSITGYSQFDDDKFVGGGVGSPERWLSIFYEEFEQISQEIRLLSPTGQTLEYILGVYVDTAEYDQANASRYQDFLGLSFFDGQIHHVFEQDSETWSAFAIGTWNVTDRLRALASVRYTQSDKEGDFDQFADYGVPLSAPRSLSDDIDEDNVDPSVTVQYDIADDVMIYGSYAVGSKAGGFVAQRAATATTFLFDEETSENYEVGLKAAFMDRRIVMNVSVYDLSFEDLQVSFFDPNIPGFVTGNAAEATSQGVEAGFAWQIVDQLRLSGSIAYQDAEYDDFPGAACLATAPPGCTPATNNLKGTTIPGASDWTGNVRAEFEQPLDDGTVIRVGVVTYYRSDYATATDQNPEYGEQDDYFKTDARLELAAGDDAWAIAIVGRNLTDQYTHNFAYLWPISPPPTGVQFLDETRNAAVELRLRL